MATRKSVDPASADPIAEGVKKAQTQISRRVNKSRPHRLTVAQRMDTASLYKPGPYNYRCQRCGLCREATLPWLPYYQHEADSSPDKLLLLLSEPTAEDEYREMAGLELGRGDTILWLKREVLAPLGLKPKDVVFLSAAKCRPSPNKKDQPRHASPGQVIACRPFVRADIWKHRPAKIIGFGEQAMQSLLGDSKATLKDHTSRIGRYSYGYWSAPYVVTYAVDAAMAEGSIGRGFAQAIRKHVGYFVQNKLTPYEFPLLETMDTWQL